MELTLENSFLQTLFQPDPKRVCEIRATHHIIDMF